MGGTGMMRLHMGIRRRLIMEERDVNGAGKGNEALMGLVVSALKKYVGCNNGVPVLLT